MKKKLSKKMVAAISISVAAVIIAGIGAAIAISAGNARVDVVPVYQIMNSWMGESQTTSGMVQSYMAQTIPHSKANTITKIYVKDGDQVEIGDPLLEYDVTILDLQQRLKKLEVQRMGLELTQLKEELAALRGLKPGSARLAGDFALADGLMLLAVAPGSAINTGELDENALYYNQTPPAGTEADPYLFLCAKGTKIQQGFLAEMLRLAAEKGDSVFARVEYRQGDTQTGELLYAYRMAFHANGEFEFDLDLPEVQPPAPSASEEPEPSAEPSPSEEPEPSMEPEPSFEPEPSIEPDPGYTADEIKQMIAEKEAEVREKELAIKKAELELKKAETQLGAEGVVKSVVKGKVKLAPNQDALQEGEALLTVTGGDGFYVQGMVNELSLSKVQPGDTVYVMNYMNGMSYEGEVVEVSDMPQQNYGFSQNPNESAYPFTVHVGGDAELTIGDYVDISYGGGAASGGNEALYIDKMYVREENGESYVFIAVDGKLKKQTVKTGATLYGWCIEVREGLSPEDYIAFPYGKLARNGTKVNLPDNTGDDMAWAVKR